MVCIILSLAKGIITSFIYNSLHLCLNMQRRSPEPKTNQLIMANNKTNNKIMNFVGTIAEVPPTCILLCVVFLKYNRFHVTKLIEITKLSEYHAR